MLSGKQKKLDADKDGKISAKDFAMLRNRPKTKSIKRNVGMDKKKYG
mgnify:CR=1 FL=1